MTKQSDAPPDAQTPTIFARASGAGRAGVAVFRLSGPGVRPIIAATTRMKAAPQPRRATLRTFINPYTDEIIDSGLLLFFAAPASFTGEDVAELHLHGSPAVEAALYRALTALGAVPAPAGAFTRRALENGKMDLTQVEGLADLIDAETAAQHAQALGQVNGRLSQASKGWRDRLLAILGPLEADVDFPDEGDVPASISAKAGPAIARLREQLGTYRREARAAQTLRDGVRIAILGRPNAGKSTLLNALAGLDAAIVSAEPGTTRDVVEVRLDLGGVPVLLFDTAGVREEASGVVEEQGIARARARAMDADLRLFVMAPAIAADAFDVSRETFGLARDGDFILWSQRDLASAPPPAAPSGFTGLEIAARNRQGVDELTTALADRAAALTNIVQHAALTRVRHVAAIDQALAALARAEQMLPHAPELAAEDARLAVRALGSITGDVDVEDVLGEIFTSFCIGK